MKMRAWGLVLMLALAAPAWALEEFKPLATLQSAAVATGNGTAIDVALYNTIAMDVSIANTATVTFEGTVDGSTWASRTCVSIANTSGTLVTSATASGEYQCNVAGLAKFRARISSWTSGAVTVTARATTADMAGGGGGGGGGTQYAEDAAHSSGDTGTMSLGVRRDANTTLAGTDGDYAPFQLDANGNVKVNVVAGGGTGGVSVAEDAAHSAGENITPLGCRRIDAAASSAGTSGDWATVDCDASGRLRTDTEMPDAAALADNTSNPTVPGVAAFLMCYDGSTWDRCQGGLTDTDDGTIAGSQVPSLVVDLGYVYDGTNWVRQRLTVGIEDAAETAGGALNMAGSVRRDVAASSAGSTGDNATVNTDALGLLWARTLDPCSGVAKTYLPISISTATTTEITPSLAGASTHYYVCSINLVTAAANNVLVADDDTDGCGSPTSGIFGSDGTPAAGEGWNFAANGGIVLGDGSSSVGRTGGTNRVICILTSAATQLSGMMVVVAAP